MDSCIKTTKQRLVSLVDKKKGASKSKMLFENPNKEVLKIIEVDNCMIKEGSRCDYLIVDSNDTEYFIELKGNSILHACKQIEETIVKISNNKTRIKFAFVVATVFPPAINGSIQIMKSKFKNKYNSFLIIKNKICTHKL